MIAVFTRPRFLPPLFLRRMLACLTCILPCNVCFSNTTGTNPFIFTLSVSSISSPEVCHPQQPSPSFLSLIAVYTVTQHNFEHSQALRHPTVTVLSHVCLLGECHIVLYILSVVLPLLRQFRGRAAKWLCSPTLAL
ncbi:hypothetical protein BC826DRAFT_1084806 [Russula brevipes]|nr:hypothetical protein BC826DRAFT_1084806 [Russula brevipes]